MTCKPQSKGEVSQKLVSIVLLVSGSNKKYLSLIWCIQKSYPPEFGTKTCRKVISDQNMNGLDFWMFLIARTFRLSIWVVRTGNKLLNKLAMPVNPMVSSRFLYFYYQYIILDPLKHTIIQLISYRDVIKFLKYKNKNLFKWNIIF